MTTHQHKKLDTDQLIAFRDRFAVPVTDEQCRACEFVRPPRASPRWSTCTHVARSWAAICRARCYLRAAEDARGISVRKFRAGGRRQGDVDNGRVRANGGALLRDAEIGKRIVPIIADEARTFGMANLFRQIGIYAPMGQLYEPEDVAQLSYYKEARDGQILEEGINEAGAMASWTAAATSYSVHGLPMLPMYIYYSMFGFQRVGDLSGRRRTLAPAASSSARPPAGRRARGKGFSIRTAPRTSSLPPSLTAAPMTHASHMSSR